MAEIIIITEREREIEKKEKVIGNKIEATSKKKQQKESLEREIFRIHYLLIETPKTHTHIKKNLLFRTNDKLYIYFGETKQNKKSKLKNIGILTTKKKINKKITKFQHSHTTRKLNYFNYRKKFVIYCKF